MPSKAQSAKPVNPVKVVVLYQLQVRFPSRPLGLAKTSERTTAPERFKGRARVLFMELVYCINPVVPFGAIIENRHMVI